MENHEAIRYTADIVVINDDRSILLIKRGWAPFEGHWALPGGHVDAGETSLQAAARELAEETGVNVSLRDLEFSGLFDSPDRDPRGRYVSAAYAVTIGSDVVPTAGDDATEARWFPLDDLPANLAFDHSGIVQAAVCG
ncbi:NUDIX domain-containing protein [Streptomyces sp. NPDC058308]|uniref:NUDIX domain-containing protein n=1 Tax=Streptomyces sp. NPDC058308 TaxID=3346440 RepID=UPI0036E2353E